MKKSLQLGLAAAVLCVAASAHATTVFQTGGDRLEATQNADGGWGWPVAGPSQANIIGPTGMGLAQAYLQTGDAGQLAALQDVGTYLLAKSHNFSPSDGYLAAQLDQIFGGTTYVDFLKTNFYNPLAAGNYTRIGDATLYSTTTYIDRIQTIRHAGGIGNIAAWDIGTGLVAAHMAGVDTTAWVQGTKDEVNALVGGNAAGTTGYYDVIGLAGAIFGLAIDGQSFDPTAGQHAAASSLMDLANILASYQIAGGGFSWSTHPNFQTPLDQTNQETAYALLALNQISRSTFISQINGGAAFLQNAQLPSGGWNDYVGDPGGENNEITGEALWALGATTVPEPPSMVLVATGLMGFALFSLKNRG